MSRRKGERPRKILRLHRQKKISSRFVSCHLNSKAEKPYNKRVNNLIQSLMWNMLVSSFQTFSCYITVILLFLSRPICLNIQWLRTSPNYVMAQCILVLVVVPANICFCFLRRLDEVLLLSNALCSNNQTNHEKYSRPGLPDEIYKRKPDVYATQAKKLILRCQLLN